MTNPALPANAPKNADRRLWLGAATAAGGAGLAATAAPFVASLAPSEKACALGAPVDVDVGSLRPGDLRAVEWRGMPLFVLHRTPEMIDTLARHDALLADPQSRRSEQHEEFIQSVPKFEEMLVGSGIKLLKYYLDVSKGEQVKRLAERRRDRLKQWKSSPIGAAAVKHWKAYSAARDAMLVRTHTAAAPWGIVQADNKRLARLHLMRDILSRLHYAGRKDKLVRPDILFAFSPDCLEAGR